MKLVLIVPNFDTYVITPQLGVMYLSSYLKKFGHEVKIIDALRDNLSYKQIMEIVEKEQPQAVGIHCLSSFLQQVIDITKLLKEKNYKVFVGGVHPTFSPRSTLVDTGADYVICGEGEIPLLKLVENNFVNNSIQGVYSIDDLQSDEFLIDGSPVLKGEVIENLDEIPFPDWDQCPPNSFPHAPHAISAKGYPIGIVTTSRGCPFRCTFCSSHNFYKGVRFRSVDNVIAEIKLLIEKYHIKELQFIDDNLTLKKSYALEVCERMIKEGLVIDWSPINGIRADAFDEELALKMKESGCYLVDFGIEAVNAQILKNIKKGETIETITKAIECSHKAGLITIGNFIFGLPGDTKATVEEAIDYAVKSKLDRAGFFALNVLPGSDIANELKKQGVEIKTSALFSTSTHLVSELSSKEIEKYVQKAYWRFYFRPKILFNILKTIPLRQYKYLFKCLQKYNIFKFW